MIRTCYIESNNKEELMNEVCKTVERLKSEGVTQLSSVNSDAETLIEAVDLISVKKDNQTSQKKYFTLIQYEDNKIERSIKK